MCDCDVADPMGVLTGIDKHIASGDLSHFTIWLITEVVDM